MPTTTTNYGTKITGGEPSDIKLEIIQDGQQQPFVKIRKTDGTTLFYIDSGGLMNGMKVYRALLTQAGSAAPVATVLENSIGAIVWTRGSAGIYAGTLTGAFTANKTFILSGGSTALDTASLNASVTSANAVKIVSIDTATSVSDDILAGSCVEIRVYP